MGRSSKPSGGTKRRPRKLAAPKDAAQLPGASEAAPAATGAVATEGDRLLGPGAVDPALADMLARADAQLAGDQPGPAPVAAAAPPGISVEQFPGLCMGASMLTSLALHKIGYSALTEPEGAALTAALLKNAEAWDLTDYLGNPKVAAALDLVGIGVAILTPRIIADARNRTKSPTQSGATERAEGEGSDALASAA